MKYRAALNKALDMIRTYVKSSLDTATAGNKSLGEKVTNAGAGGKMTKKTEGKKRIIASNME